MLCWLSLESNVVYSSTETVPVLLSYGCGITRHATMLVHTNKVVYTKHQQLVITQHSHATFRAECGAHRGWSWITTNKETNYFVSIWKHSTFRVTSDISFINLGALKCIPWAYTSRSVCVGREGGARKCHVNDVISSISVLYDVIYICDSKFSLEVWSKGMHRRQTFWPTNI